MVGGTEFRYLRLKRWMSQKSVAEAIGVSRGTLSRYELEKADMPITVTLKLSKLFKLTESELMSVK